MAPAGADQKGMYTPVQLMSGYYDWA